MSKSRTRILWTVNITLPNAATNLGLSKSPFGGWLSEMSKHLASFDDVELAIAMRAPVRSLVSFERDRIKYYAVPQCYTNKYDVSQNDCNAILEEFKPDILHAQGSEMAFTRRFFKSWNGTKAVSLQGIINGYAPYQLGRLPIMHMLNPFAPKQFLIAIALLLNERIRFRPRLKVERDTLALADFVLGRTLWDQAHAKALSPHSEYLHCGELLREEFSSEVWSKEQCEIRSIFIGNAAAPLKGAHIALKAAALLKEDFPDLQIYIAGQNPLTLSRWSIRGLFSYSAYLNHLISELGLNGCVNFTGLLDATQMSIRMRRSHVYVLPSLIENSPNTLGEAMMLGVPAVASFAGGVPTMVADEKEALLYRPDDHVMLAMQVRRLFDDNALCESLSQSSRKRARDIFNIDTNLAGLIEAYRKMLGKPFMSDTV